MYGLINIITGKRVVKEDGTMSKVYPYASQAQSEWEKYFESSPFITIVKFSEHKKR